MSNHVNTLGRPRRTAGSRSLLSSLVFLLLFSATSASGISLCGEVCRVSMRPELLRLYLPLAGWLYDQTVVTEVTVLEGPRFGTWENEVYTPSADFWRVGGDQVKLLLDDELQGPREHVIIFGVASQLFLSQTEEDFEDGDLSQLSGSWYLIGSNAELVDDVAISGDWSLSMSVGKDGFENNTIYDGGDDTTTGMDQVGGEVVVNVPPPDQPIHSRGFASVDVTTSILGLDGLAFADLRWDGEALLVRATASAETCTPRCATPWHTIQPGVDYRMLLQMGLPASGGPGSGWTLDLIVESLDGTTRIEEQLTGLPPANSFQGAAIGDLQSFGTGTLTVLFDDFSSWLSTLTGHGQDALVESFDSGLVSGQWLPSGPVSVQLDSRTISYLNWHGEADVLDVLQGGGDAEWWTSAANGSRSIWLHMLVDLALLNLPPQSTFTLAELVDSATGQPFLVLRGRVNAAGVDEVSLSAATTSRFASRGSWVEIGPSGSVDIAWGADGFDLWVEGQHLSFGGNFSQVSVGGLRFGVISPQNGSGLLPAGSLVRFDDLVLLY